MKKIMLVVSSLMMIGLIIGMYFYEKQRSSKPVTQKEKLEAQVKEMEQTGPEVLQPMAADEEISYTLQNDELSITYNNGETWTKVPINKELLFQGEYNGNEQELIEHSYIINNKIAAFLYANTSEGYQNKLLLKYSFDKGKTWEETVITDKIIGLRFRKVDFLNESFGYVIISGERTMSFEASTVFLTHDGGSSWQETANSGVTRLISDGGFINESTGFLSFGTINPEEPDVYVTEDGGETWTNAVFQIPDDYKRIFVTAEVPIKEGNHLAVLVNQGANGDYKGGKVKGKFLSDDNGKTWEFQQEVEPNE